MSCSIMTSLKAAVLYCLLAFAYGKDDDIIYPTTYAKQQLATRIHCQVEETQHFRYSSVTKLWSTMGGDVILSADVALHCLGDDRGGKYESEALKYLVEISNLIIEEKNERREEPMRRRKRGVGDVFKNAWSKVKSFFSRVFGRNRGSGPPQDSPDPSVNKRKEGSGEDEDEDDAEEFNLEDLQPLYSVPFQFLQLANGSIPEIRFAENEIEDGRIRNFKRHLVDAFATQLNFEQRQKDVIETTVTGEHMSSYNITINGESLSINLAGFSIPQENEPTVTVKKLVTGDHIRKLAPSEALNDKEKMQLTLEQMQVFKDGKLISSSGTSSIVLLPDANTGKRSRRKREEEDDITSNFQAHSSFEIKLYKRQRRSAEDTSRIKSHEKLTFLPVSRFAEREDSTERQKLRRLQQSAGDMTQIIKNLLEFQGDDYDETMQIISEMVHREVDLKLDNESQSAANVVRRLLDKETLEAMCANNFTICKDFLQLLAVAGGPRAEEVFLSFLKQETSLTTMQLRMIAGVLTDLSSPSSGFLDSLVQLISEKKLNADVMGSVCLGSGSLGSRAEVKVKNKISKTLTDLLSEQKDDCRVDGSLLDILEAIGNLGCRKSVQSVLEVSRKCQSNTAIEIACAHALRHNSDLSSVKQWIENRTNNTDCDVIKAIIGALLDKIQEQQMIGDTSNWPRVGFNRVDENLKELLVKSRCSVEDTILYFSKKKDPVANSIAQNYYGPEAEPWDPSSNSRQKRALWDNLNCNEWTEDNKFRPIQDKEEFASDRAIYNKRKSCLAFRRLGVKGANAEIYAGMFAGVKEPSDPPKYKLFTKFVSGLNFLGNQMEIGSFYFYHYSGNTKAYVRILGQTRQEFTHDGCTPTDLKYRPIKHIPLYMVSISTVQLSLGIHLSSKLAMDTECPDDGIYRMEPMTDVRIGGEALGTVSMARGGVNLGGNFNYRLQFTFTPTPNMCLTGSHGYDPMSISFETFYQLWNTVKKDWGKHRTWKPNFLSWDIKNGDLKQWFKDTCIRTEDHGSSINVEREIE